MMDVSPVDAYVDIAELSADIPDPEHRSALLRAATALDQDGFAAILDLAAAQLGSAPRLARRIGEWVARYAPALLGAACDAPVARAAYLRARAHFINAEFDEALALIDEARAGYLRAGALVDALRTDVGLMSVLVELGRYDEALAAGARVTDMAAGIDGADARLLHGMARQNCGMALQLLGRFDEAARSYEHAEALFSGLGENERLGDVTNNRGVLLLNQGRAHEARTAFEAAIAVFSNDGNALKHAQALINLAGARLQLGAYSLGLAAYETARALLLPLDAEADKHVLLLDLADAHRTLNLHPEALAAYREAERALGDAGMQHDRARALWGIGDVLLAQHRWDEAGTVLARAAQAFEDAGNLPMLCGVQLRQAALQSARGDRRGALALARKALSSASGQNWTLQQAAAHLRIADILFPDAAQALPHLRAAQALAGRVGLPGLRTQIDEQLGRAMLLQGKLDEAESALRAAIAQTERTRQSLAHERLRAAFLGDRLDAHESLLRLYFKRGGAGDLARAFEVNERAKSRALNDLLSGAIAPATLTGDANRQAPDMRTLQHELDAVYTALLRAATEGGDADMTALNRRAVTLEQTLSRMQLQAGTLEQPDGMRNRTIDDAAATRTSPALDVLADALLISYAICGDDVYAFVADRHGVRQAACVCALSSVRPMIERLHMQIDRFREDPAFVARHMDMLTRSAQRVLAELYDALIRPIERHLNASGPAPVVVAPHGALHQVPFHCLFDGESYLIDRCALSYAPGLTTYAMCKNRGARSPQTAAVFGVADALIPEAASEARAVAEQLPNAELRTGPQATLGAFRELAAGRDVVHIACHGFFRADNPLFSSLKLGDGWLMAVDVPAVPLHGALVTLSACESGRSQVLAGDELIGLTRGFLGAGAAALVTSLWLVNDTTTARLMARFYRALTDPGTARADALRTAQLAVRDTHPHPYYWAPFILQGAR